MQESTHAEAAPRAPSRSRMNMTSPRPAQASPAPAPGALSAQALPAEWVRTAVSFLIFLHLFALAVGILASEVPSELETALAERTGLRHYLQLLDMNLPYSYYFTRGNDPGGELDIDYSLVATIKRPDGETETIEYPSAGMWPRQRFHRYQVLARNLATFASDEAPVPENLETLAGTVVRGILNQNGIERLDLRVRGQLTPPAMEEFNPDTYTDRFRDAYDAHAFLSGDRVELLKKEPARDTAPPATKDQ
jgi:hypothetical protein